MGQAASKRVLYIELAPRRVSLQTAARPVLHERPLDDQAAQHHDPEFDNCRL